MLTPEMFSELKPYSLGVVAENKKLTGKDGKPNRIVEVTPIEDTPMLNGEIKSGIVTDKVSSLDRSGGEFEIKVDTANSISATWLPLGSANRFTAPDVRRGEMVMLYRFADEDRFFWTTLFDDIKLRKLETAIYAWSGTQKEGAEVNGDNYYFFEVSTHKGVVHFHTSKANGEFTAVDIQLNTKDGVFQLRDETGHIFLIDFKEKQMAMQNPDGTSIDINKKNLTIQVPETYKLMAKNKIEEIGETVNITSGNSISEKTKTFNIDASSGLTEKVGKYDLNSSGAINQKAGGPITIDGTGVKISKGVALS
jgi:hypothetical protein